MITPTSATSNYSRFGYAGTARLRDRKGGFTLLETLLALSLIGLIAALILPWTLPDRSSAALRLKAFEIAAVLRSDRNVALSSGRPVVTSIDLGARRIRSGASGAVIVVPETFDLQLVSADLSGFRFDADSRASGGELRLTRRKAAVAVRVNRVTAAVEIVAR